MADNETPNEPPPKRKPPPDAQKFGRAEYEAKRYRDKGKIYSNGRLNVNAKLTAAARKLYPGELQSVKYILSKSMVEIYLQLRGEIEDGNGDSIAVVYDKKARRTCSISLSKPLAGLGIRVPAGYRWEVTTTVEDVEGFGPCIVLELKHRVVKATRSNGEKQEEQDG